MTDHREIPVRSTRTGMSNYGSHNNNPYVQISSVPTSSAASNGPNPMDKVCDALNRCGRKVEKATRQAEIMADNFWNHVRFGSNLADEAIARIVQGTKVLALGGPDMFFQRTCGTFPGEKLITSYACYISTSFQPVIGTLYITTKRLVFCSDYPLGHHPFSLQNHSINYYKVTVQLDQLSTANSFTNRLNPSEKYIQIVTVDGYEFCFVGFIAHDKAFKTIKEALQQYRNHSRGDITVEML